MQLFTGPHGEELRQHIGILPASTFNTPLPVLLHHHPENFIFHAAGESAGIRNHLLFQFYEEALQKVNSTKSDSAYLGPRLAPDFLRASLISHYREELREDPHNAELLNKLGIALIKENRFLEAIDAFEEAVALYDARS